MKINTKMAIGFLKKVCMNRDAAVKECILQFKDEGLEILTTVAANVVMVDAFLKRSCFEDYEALGSIGIDDLSFMVKCLERFQDEFVVMKKKENLLVISDSKKKVEFLLVEVEFLEKPPQYPKNMVHETTIDLNYESIKDFLTDATTIGALKISFNKSKNGKLLLKALGMKHTMETEIDVPLSVDGLKVEFTELFVDVVQNLSGILKVGLKDNYPILLSSDFEGGYVRILMAPNA